MEAGTENGFLAEELSLYYKQKGRSLSGEILDAVSKDPLRLTRREKELFIKFVLPRRRHIKEALKERFMQSGSKREAWFACLAGCSQSIIGQLAVEMLLEEGALPEDFLSRYAVSPAPEHPLPARELLRETAPSPQPETTARPAAVARLQVRKVRSRRRKAASPLGWGVFIGIVAIMAVIGILAGRGSWWKGGGAEVAGTTALPLDVECPLQDQTFSVFEITVSGRTAPYAEIIIFQESDGRSVACRADAEGYFSAGITLAEGTNNLTVTASSEGASREVSLSCRYELDTAAYKSTCQQLDYGPLSKNPDAYRGKRLYVTGSIESISGSGNATDITLNVTKNKYGVWSNAVFVTYRGEVSARKFSVITVYGEIQGSYSTLSPDGKVTSMPLLGAKVIEVVQR